MDPTPTSFLAPTLTQALNRSNMPSCRLQRGALWLREWCARTGPGGAPAAAAAGDDALALAACRVLFLGRSPDEAAAELFDLLGDNAFEAIGELMEHR